MNVNSKVLSVTHCIVCDELPTAKGNFATQLDKLQAEHDATVTWRRCRLCKVPDTTMAHIVIQSNIS